MVGLSVLDTDGYYDESRIAILDRIRKIMLVFAGFSFVFEIIFQYAHQPSATFLANYIRTPTFWGMLSFMLAAIIVQLLFSKKKYFYSALTLVYTFIILLFPVLYPFASIKQASGITYLIVPVFMGLFILPLAYLAGAAVLKYLFLTSVFLLSPVDPLVLQAFFIFNIVVDTITYIIYKHNTIIRQRELALQHELMDMKSQEAMIGLAARASHDLNNIFTIMSSTLELGGPHLDEKDFLAMQNYLKLAGNLSSNLLKVSRIADGAETSNLHILLITMTDGIRALNSSVNFELDLDPELDHYQINSNDFSKIYLNLLMNAIEAVGHGGNIVISTNANNTLAFRPSLEIWDDGHGIPYEAQRHIFSEYFTTKTNGTGLGLAIVQQILMNMNADITFVSNPGEFTSFTIYFPNNDYD